MKEQGAIMEKITAKNIPQEELLASGHRACQGCGEMLAMRMAMKVVGANAIVVNATGCMEVVTSPYPETAWRVPWLHVAFENAAAVGSGVEAARKAMLRKGRLEQDQAKVVVMGGDGGTSDIGFQALSGAMERGHDLTYICFDNEAYMNTGIQRSSATPWGAWTTTSPLNEQRLGKTARKKDLPLIMADHHIPYVATASPAHHLDLMNKVKKAVNTTGPAFLHIFSPCPTGWRMPAQYALKAARLAVSTHVYPLYEVLNGRYVLSRRRSKPRPVEEYLRLQGRFKHLTSEHIQTIQAEVDETYAELEWRASRDVNSEGDGKG